MTFFLMIYGYLAVALAILGTFEFLVPVLRYQESVRGTKLEGKWAYYLAFLALNLKKRRF